MILLPKSKTSLMKMTCELRRYLIKDDLIYFGVNQEDLELLQGSTIDFQDSIHQTRFLV
jgi:hypothetical protein